LADLVYVELINNGIKRSVKIVQQIHDLHSKLVTKYKFTYITYEVN